jgi:hypothetical protein
MALTLESEQRMDDAGVVGFYQASEAEWLATATATKAFVVGNFPAGA